MALKVFHYLNQFYGGIGGEDKGDSPPLVKDGPVGPGLPLQQALGEHQIVGTFICGDNYYHAHADAVLDAVVAEAKRRGADVVVAGPAFAAGRYGLACTHVCNRVQQAGIAAVTAMHTENPGADVLGVHVYILPAGDSGADMRRLIPLLARFAIKLGLGQPIGSARAEGYLPRGSRKNVRLQTPAAVRGVDLLLQKLAGQPVETELPLEVYDRVVPPPPVADLGRAIVALVTEAGVVPIGNPDGIEAAKATKWARYSISGKQDLVSGDFTSIHGGYDSTWMNEDPDRILPVDVLRSMESEGQIGALLDEFFVTCGSVGNVTVMRRLGAEIAEELVRRRVTAVILPAT